MCNWIKLYGYKTKLFNKIDLINLINKINVDQIIEK